jgi:hypothetical protein
VILERCLDRSVADWLPVDDDGDDNGERGENAEQSLSAIVAVIVHRLPPKGVEKEGMV